MTANPLVAGAADPTTGLSGTGLLESVSSTARAIESKDWVGAGLSGFATAMDTIVAAIDPIGTLIAWGAGWLIDHLQPLKGWLNDLTGDAGAVAGFAQTWVNVAGRMEQEATFLRNRVSAELEGIRGEAAAAYRAYAANLADYIGGMKEASAAVAGGLQVASTIVQVVHELVRDTLAQIVGSLASAIIQAVASFGVLIPKVIADVSARVASLAARIGKTVRAVVEALGKLRNLVKQLGEAMDDILALLRRRKRRSEGGSGGSTPGGNPNPPPVHDGKQGKHVPGHPNNIPSRSQLSQDPESLRHYAGTGDQIGSTPPGQPGYKERVETGEVVGTYRAPDGTEAPSTVLIIVHAKDGTIHMYPGQPSKGG